MAHDTDITMIFRQILLGVTTGSPIFSWDRFSVDGVGFANICSISLCVFLLLVQYGHK